MRFPGSLPVRQTEAGREDRIEFPGFPGFGLWVPAGPRQSLHFPARTMQRDFSEAKCAAPSCYSEVARPGSVAGREMNFLNFSSLYL